MLFRSAKDANGGDVYGSSFAWTAAGQSLAGNINSNDPTDLLTYQYHSSGSEVVAASVDSQSATATVHGAPGTTSTSTSENVGCSVAHGAGAAGSSVAGILIGLAFLASRRRARR